MSTLITGIGTLVTNDPHVQDGYDASRPDPEVDGASTAAPAGPASRSGRTVSHDADPLGQLHGAAVVIEEGRIAWVGPADHAPAADDAVDLGGQTLIPGFVDSHTHPVFAGDRADEFDARMNGEKYDGGGIRRTMAATRAAGDADLHAMVTAVVNEMLRQGTTTVEGKTGYGLDVDTEVRMARILAETVDEVTFLGAHTVPPEHSADEYVDLVCGPMLDAVREHVSWIDVFCEKGAFDAEQSLQVLRAGKRAGLGMRLHAAQLNPSSIIADAVELGVASIDHCTFLSDMDVSAIADSHTVATVLPAAEFSTRQPYPDASRLLRAGATVALATDCNPGTAFTSSMPFCLAVAVREMSMTPEQALWSATAGGAAALRRGDVGVVRPGARADLVSVAAPSWLHLFYRPGVPLISQVWRRGVCHQMGAVPLPF